MKKESIKTLIIEDEASFRSLLKGYLSEREDIEIVGEAITLQEAIQEIREKKPDLVLLDVKLGNELGLDIFKEFIAPSFKTVFVTAFNDFILNALRAGALDYLLKPFNKEELFLAIDRYHKSQNDIPEQYNILLEHIQEKQTRITFRTTEGLNIVQIDHIVYCESDGCYTTFFMKDKSKLVASKNIKEFENILPVKDFFRVHKSYLVNVNYLTLVTGDNNLILKNLETGWQSEVPVSQRKREGILRFLENKN